MILLTGNMWDEFHDADYFIFTGNAFVKNNGALVMGRGIAKQVRDTFRGIDVRLGTAITAAKLQGASGNFYGTIVGKKIGVFQVKYHWSDKADLGLIAKSAEMLLEIANNHPSKTFHMNFPGIGNGHLKYEDVLPLLEFLPDNVFIWTFK